MGRKPKPITFNTVFDWVGHITTHKTPLKDIPVEAWNKWNSFMVHKVLSMTPEYIHIVNLAQTFLPQDKKQIYQVYLEFIPQKKVWSKYIKSSKKNPPKDILELVSTYFSCSQTESIDYVNILSKDELGGLFKSLGKDEKEIKKLIKSY